ncbi:M4 family metallopeptidase [Arthrobacter sp. zg-Y859]|uniref:Neutral metalloproteinase n=1 Tax=Arthrobacter jinronghuae TaxID=2964609 RepID=A0ABT1NMQ9_9MICC|nr:M4 family metallopeptidase [Arthrobacter jinronghuae]MCQ1948998.1 M4 family metallopeptidase [Arthrobacter jinronghuae]UWX78202.1 M4 family metallopeptidase [Arthrobacter jinronghuae]
MTNSSVASSICSIVPPYLLARLAAAEDPAKATAAKSARRALTGIDGVESARSAPHSAPSRGSGTAFTPSLRRTISDALGLEELPGTVVRSEGQPDTGDPAVDETYAGLGATYRLFSDAYGRSSLDGAGRALEATVHYGRAYDNAFWDGSRMVLGDGDGEVFERFSKSLTVIGHELTHGIIQYTAQLDYRDQAGALNESIADVFGVLVEQKLLGQTADQASWLVGEGLFTDLVQGQALRSLKAPGTAYDDDVLGKDPQPGSMADFVKTAADNGGVHINSGIPNRAFYLVAEALGGYAWERAGQVWYDTITERNFPADATFAVFAAATLTAAEKRYGAGTEESTAVQAAWKEVNVLV